ncbi:GLR1 protein, partial [Pseudoatta argentina]
MRGTMLKDERYSWVAARVTKRGNRCECETLVGKHQSIDARRRSTCQRAEINIGAIFEQGTDEVQNAFKFAMMSHNQNITTRKFELQAFVDVINTADAYKLSRLNAFFLARASLQIRLQPPAVVASRLLVFSRCKEKKGRIEEKRNERKHHEKKEKGPVPIEQGEFEKRGKSEGVPLQIEWQKRPDGFIVEAIESTNTATTNRLSRENATRARFD